MSIDLLSWQSFPNHLKTIRGTERVMLSGFAIVDLFAGPGGLAEGFSSVRDRNGNRPFNVVLSIEKEKSAFKTLLLRSFLRQFGSCFPQEYHDWLNGKSGEPDWPSSPYRRQWDAALSETLNLELGAKGTAAVVDDHSHPDTLIVTARNKMGSGEQVVVSIGLGNEFIETTILRRDGQALQDNRDAVLALTKELSKLGKPLTSAMPVGAGWLVTDVPVDPVLDFLSAFRNHGAAMITSPEPVRKYIERRQNGELSMWDVLFAGSARSDHIPLVDTSLGVSITCQRRRAGSKSSDSTLLVTDNQRVASRGVEKAGLSAEEAAAAEADFRNGKAEPASYPDKIYRDRRKKPLLIIHLLSIGKKDDDLSKQMPTVAWSISFPRTALEEERVEYVVNTTWLRENYRDELDGDEMQGDDE